MEVMRLKHGFSLIIIILLFNNVALVKVLQEYSDEEKEGNYTEEEEDNYIEENEENYTEEEKYNYIEEEEENYTEEEEENNIDEEEENYTEQEEGNYTEQEEGNYTEDEEENNIDEEEENYTEEEEENYSGETEEYSMEDRRGNATEEKRAIGARKPATFHWPTGTVPYSIKHRHYDTIVAARIRAAMHTIQSSSCVVFKDMIRNKRQSPNLNSPWLSIENPDGVRECSHTTLREEGTYGAKAILIVGYDCMQPREILHALLHALGFKDEVTHPQRDTYIRVVWPNIQPKYRSLFYIKKNEASSQKMVEYDSMSVMHFHDRAYTINGGATILPQIPGLLIAPSDSLSQLDVMKLRLAYGHECNKRKVASLLRTCQIALGDDSDSN